MFSQHKINNKFHGAKPNVLWTGPGYHIYQSVKGFILEEIGQFAQFINSNKKNKLLDLCNLLKAFFTDKKGDPQHRPSIKSCLRNEEY